MKIINFTAVEILPKLLSKEKTQTIRKAWEKGVISFGLHTIKDKPPRYKVGEKVQIMWSGYYEFELAKHLSQIANDKTDETNNTKYVGDFNELNYNRMVKQYDETIKEKLGEAEIVKVFKIKMQRFDVLIGNELTPIVPKYTIFEHTEKEMKEIAKLDGFESAEDMFKWFDERYDLSTPKEFYVYRWVWK